MTFVDTTSGTWTAIRDHLNAELVRLREKNDRDCPIEETIAIRAEIRAIKNLLALPQAAAQQIPVQPDSYEPHSLM